MHTLLGRSVSHAVRHDDATSKLEDAMVKFSKTKQVTKARQACWLRQASLDRQDAYHRVTAGDG